jgi:hypothetical protein
MNKGCSYTAQGQFVCHVETAATVRESFRGFSGIEHFADSDIKVDPSKLNKKQMSGLDPELKDFRTACLMKEQTKKNGDQIMKIIPCSLKCSSLKTDNCELNCPACTSDKVPDANQNNYCSNTKTTGKKDKNGKDILGSVCTPPGKLTFTGRANTTTVNGKKVTDIETNEYIVYYNGKLYKNPEEANKAKINTARVAKIPKK